MNKKILSLFLALVGPNHVCAVSTQRDVWCFGNNTFGQFGIGTTSTARTDEPRTPANH